MNLAGRPRSREGRKRKAIKYRQDRRAKGRLENLLRVRSPRIFPKLELQIWRFSRLWLGC